MAGLLLQAPAASAAGAPPFDFLAPSTVRADGAPAGPDVALNRRGDAVAVWTNLGLGVQLAGVIETATRPAGGAWSPPVALTAPDADASSVQVALDDGGNAVAVWIRSRPDGPVVEAATRPRGAAWSAPETLSGPGSLFPQVAVSSRGEAVAIWSRRADAAGFVVETASRRHRQDWSAPRVLSAPDSELPQLALSRSGAATAVWLRSGSQGTVEAATRSAHGAWSAPRVLAVGASGPQIALTDRGDAIVAWETGFRDDGSSLIQAATRRARADWSAPVTLSDPAAASFNPQVAAGRRAAVVVWRRLGTTGSVIEASVRRSAGAWAAPAPLSGSELPVLGPRIGVSGRGDALAVWQRRTEHSTAVEAVALRARGAWSAPQVLAGDSTTDRFAFGVQLAVNRRGDAVVIWPTATSIVAASTR